MTEEQIKEQMSRHFVELLANREGYTCTKPDPDHGADLNIERAHAVEINGERVFLPGGELVQLQLKSTCERNITRTETGIRYDLEARAYNKLVYRRNQPNSPVPYLLVLLVLPDDETEWLTISPDELVLRRDAYWYYPEENLPHTPNTGSKRIVFPYENVLVSDFCSSMFARHF